MFVERFGVRLLHFSFLFVVLLNLSFHLLFNIIGSSHAWFVSKKKNCYNYAHAICKLWLVARSACTEAAETAK